MHSVQEPGTVLVTGACGQIGRAVCELLQKANIPVLPVDLDAGKTRSVRICDLRCKDDVAQLFRDYPIRAAIHLAAILPGAFQLDPLAASDINLTASIDLLRQAAEALACALASADAETELTPDEEVLLLHVME